jgi:hypothetical protein
VDFAPIFCPKQAIDFEGGGGWGKNHDICNASTVRKRSIADSAPNEGLGSRRVSARFAREELYEGTREKRRRFLAAR